MRREVLNHSTKCFKCIEEAHCYETHVVLPAKKKKKERKRKKNINSRIQCTFHPSSRVKNRLAYFFLILVIVQVRMAYESCPNEIQ